MIINSIGIILSNTSHVKRALSQTGQYDEAIQYCIVHNSFYLLGITLHDHQLKNFITPQNKKIVHFHMKMSIFSFWRYFYFLA